MKENRLLFLVALRRSLLSIYDRVMVIVDGRLRAIDEPDPREQEEFLREITDITPRQGAR